MVRAPDALPLLSRGKHRRPADGACFMEMASVLAGLRWSDDPPCTHPLLARLARLVNDLTSDAGRGALAPLVPSVVGLTSTDPRWDTEIALAAAAHALPRVAPYDQQPLAAGLLTCESLLGDVRHDDVRVALAAAPEAAAWAQEYLDRLGGPAARRHPGPAVVEHAARALAARRGRDDELRLLLERVVDRCTALRAAAAAPPARSTSVPALHEASGAAA